MCCGNKEYAPDKCCLLPEIINSALASATKRRNFNKYVNVSGYPIGVAYNATKDKYYARITQGLHHSDMTNRLYYITGTKQKKHFKNICYSRNQRLEY